MRNSVRIKTILGRAIELESASERAAFLERACEGNVVLRAEVEALLAGEQAAGDFMSRPAGAVLGSDPAVPGASAALTAFMESESIGECIGQYKLVQLLGEGGMGSVYMAEQIEPVQRYVALKIVKLGMDSKQVIARFEAERQALAMMDHPHIAKVFDAGTTTKGRPFFVMELVRGVPLTKYCDGVYLPLRDRLRLFMQACEAIQHAHYKGIIHRDVKPSNVLVALQDDKPVVKVIDFGVAKAMNQTLSAETMFTQAGAIIGTLEYMSPEQAELNALGIDARTDIYSLGVILYELLTGTTPLDHNFMRKAAFVELLRMIREVEPPKPSTRISSHHDQLADIAAKRKIDPLKLPRLLKGELDWIAMRALEKDRTRRYGSAAGLARDVERYLADEPVDACPPSYGYKMGKFVRKHKGAMAAAASIMLALIALIVVLYQSASRERELRAVADTQKGIAVQKAKDEAGARAETQAQLKKTEEALTESKHQEGVAWLERAHRKVQEHSEFAAAMMAAQALSFKDFGRPNGDPLFNKSFPLLLRSESDFSREADSIAGRASGKPIWQSGQLEGYVTCVSFSPDGVTLASAGEELTVRLWDVATGTLKARLEGHTSSVYGVSFSSDGATLASASADKTVRLWDVATGKQRAQLEGHTYFVHGLSFSPDGTTLASGGGDQTVRLWDVATGKQKAQFDRHRRRFYSLSFSPDGATLASGSEDTTVWLWDVATGKPKAQLEGHTSAVRSVSFSPDGATLASGSDDNTVRLWDVAKGTLKAQLQGHTSSIHSVSFSSDGATLASASADETVRLWDVATGAQKTQLEGHTVVYGVSFSPDCTTLALASWDKTVRLWDVAAGKQMSQLRGHASKVHLVSFSPDGKTLASGSADKTVRLWDAATGKQKAKLEGHAKEPWSICFSRDGTALASGSADKTVRLWDVATGTQKAKLEGHTATVNNVCFSPDGATLASGSEDQTVRLWDVVAQKQTAVLEGHLKLVYSVSFSPDGATLASGGHDETVRLWDVAGGKQKAILEGHSDTVWSVSFSPDGATLATGSEDLTVRLWDVSMRKQKTQLKGHTRGVWSVNFSPDGATLASWSEDQTVRLWDVVSGKLKATYPENSLRIPEWFRTYSRESRGSITAFADSPRIDLFDTSLKLDYAAYLSYFKIERDGVRPIDAPNGMPYLNVNPHCHIGILQSGKPLAEINRLLFWRYYQAWNKNSCRLMLTRLPAGREKDDAHDAFDRRFGVTK